jgi:arylsulfatase A-like enzyme/O-glycosyl hydrolase
MIKLVLKFIILISVIHSVFYGRGPNILFIAIDDLRPELGIYGSKVKTPHMDRLAETGVLFKRAYCQQAVCGASRLSIMGGLYPTLTGEQTFHVDGWRNRHPHLLTLNQYFMNNGYNTIGLGKIYHGNSGPGVDPQNWSQWVKSKNVPHYAKKGNIEALNKSIKENKVEDNKARPKGPLTESADVHDDTYTDGQTTTKAVEILKSLSQKKNSPFFLAIGLTKPHLPFVAPKKYWDLYNREEFKMPANKSIPPGYPVYAANQFAYEMHKYSDFEGMSPKDFSDNFNKRLLHGYAACTSYTDACVGRILNALKKNNLTENTIVVLWGDHGWKLGDHSSWCKHTNFECDTRVPLIIRDPRLEGGKKTERLVELIDLYPTLCELTGIPIPQHCQGRSFKNLIKDPEANHRLDAYSSYPASKNMGHSIRFKNYRYTEWRDPKGKTVAQVLTDLKSDPGEVTNCINDANYAEDLAYAKKRLNLRINESCKPKVSNKPKSAQKQFIQINPTPENLRQSIDGFGGSIAFWGTRADEEAMEYAFKELKTSILRAQGEVSKKGIIDHNRVILQRAMKLNPKLEVLLTFWQPRSSTLLKTEDWLDEIKKGENKQYCLKPKMEDEWAKEIVSRVKQYIEWGINVTNLGVQNETNYSHLGTQTCIWDPVRLRDFIEKKLKPRLDQAGLHVLITAPDLAYIGYKGSELKRFLPTIRSTKVDLVAYHMYDSYKEGTDGSLDILRENSRQIGMIRKENFPNKKFWMTETTGAQWNNDVWHTYGWFEGATEFDKAILAARYMHMTFAQAEANAFLWWGLLYSLAPDRVKHLKTRQKHRDEGLVLVEEKRGADGYQKFLEKTKKFYFFKQYANFIWKGSKRIELKSPDPLEITAYQTYDKSRIVVIVLNPSDTAQAVDLKLPQDMDFKRAFQTDRKLNCEPVPNSSPLPGKSIRTYIFSR